ncbi:MAG: general substrate transporter [Benjaminiella poitrasii]|nr:MAG: general substrate transporter [Benjaminiella poitrasii]
MLIVPSFQKHFGIDPDDKIQEANINGTIVSVLQIGCLFGALLATSTADTLGRKLSIMAAAFIFTIGGVLQIIGCRLGMLYAGRIISGLGVGALSMLVPIYVAEIAHQKYRGLLGGLWMFFIATGLALSYWTNYIARKLIDDDNDMLWRVPLIVQVIPSIVLCLGMIFLFETPRWLCAHHQHDKAYQVLSKIRGTTDVKDEMAQIRASVDTDLKRTDASGSWREIISSANNRKRLVLGCTIQALQQLTGTNVINYFGPIIFRSIGLSSSEAELFATGVYGILKMIVVLVGFSSLIDRFGRRPLLIGGGFAMSICMFAVSVTIMLSSSIKRDAPTEENTSISTVSIIVTYAVFFALSWGPCPWIYCSEIYSMNTRAKSTSLTTAVNWIMNAIIGKVSPIMLATSTFGTYMFFGSWCIVASIFCYLFVPETKGKTLEEINELFSN